MSYLHTCPNTNTGTPSNVMLRLRVHQFGLLVKIDCVKRPAALPQALNRLSRQACTNQELHLDIHCKLLLRLIAGTYCRCTFAEHPHPPVPACRPASIRIQHML